MESRNGVVVVEEAAVHVQEQTHGGAQEGQRAKQVEQQLLQKVSNACSTMLATWKLLLR